MTISELRDYISNEIQPLLDGSNIFDLNGNKTDPAWMELTDACNTIKLALENEGLFATLEEDDKTSMLQETIDKLVEQTHTFLDNCQRDRDAENTTQENKENYDTLIEKVSEFQMMVATFVQDNQAKGTERETPNPIL